MSPVDSKRKGSDFEREVAKLLPEVINNSEWKRIPTSGAIGTRMGVPILFSDLIGRVKGFSKKFRAEAKVGYGGAKQFMLKKEWLDKVIQEARSTYTIPFLIGKFSGAREGVRHFVVLDLDTFSYFINYITALQDRIDLDEELYGKGKKVVKDTPLIDENDTHQP